MQRAMRRPGMVVLLAYGSLVWSTRAHAQQVPDSTYQPRVARPEYPAGRGPVILVDGAHRNVHTIAGQFLGFARLARADGYRVQSLDLAPTADRLRECALLVIASPRNALTLHSRQRPIWNAYHDAEVAVVREWVRQGGSLLLIADHMPVVGSMKNLLDAFELPAIDGFATTLADTTARLPIVYRRSDGTLKSNAITNGRSLAERVDSMATFTGAALLPTPAWRTLWQLPDSTVVIVTDEPWSFPSSAPRVPGKGLAQGAVRTFGKGRVVFSAEAALFTAQREGSASTAMGMNHAAASQNAQFVLNILHWLTGPESQAPAGMSPRSRNAGTPPA